MHPRTLNVGHRALLLDFMAESLALSRKKAKSLIDQRVVFVNNARVWMARHQLERGDRVEIHADVRGDAAPRAPRAIPILFEDQDYLVVDKPAGLLSNGPGSLEERLREDRQEPALSAVHRLDRDTSGCLLMARNAEAGRAIIAQFHEKAVGKIYHAIAMGRVSPGVREIDAPIDGKPAVTKVHVIRSSSLATHLKLVIETGRTHQIRKHLLRIRHPLAGDKQYATGAMAVEVFRRIPRQMLHAAAISFKHPATGAPISAHAPLPRDFMQCLKALQL